MFDAGHVQYSIVGGFIQIVSAGHHLPAYWAHPELGGPFPGLVLLHEQWGLNAHIRSLTRRFAEAGYYVIAPDLFGGERPATAADAQRLADEAGETMRSRVAAAIHALTSHHRCNDRIGLAGWGMGGRLALEIAGIRDDIRGTVTFYGLSNALVPSTLLMITCPVLILLGEDDPDSPPDEIDRLRTRLDGANIPHDIVSYPGAGRGFFDDTRPEYHADSAQDAWTRTLDFLNEQLAPPEHPTAF